MSLVIWLLAALALLPLVAVGVLAGRRQRRAVDAGRLALCAERGITVEIPGASRFRASGVVDGVRVRIEVASAREREARVRHRSHLVVAAVTSRALAPATVHARRQVMTRATSVDGLEWVRTGDAAFDDGLAPYVPPGSPVPPWLDERVRRRLQELRAARDWLLALRVSPTEAAAVFGNGDTGREAIALALDLVVGLAS